MSVEYLITIVCVSVLSCTAGTFATWNQNIFFGHILSHTLLLPPAIALYFGVDSHIVIAFISVLFGALFAIICFELEDILTQNKDAVLILSSLFFTALAIIFTTKSKSLEELMRYITGDILFITMTDTVFLVVCSAIWICYIIRFWSTIVLNSLNRSIAITIYPNAKQIMRVGVVLHGISIVLQTKAIGSMFVSGANMLPPILARMITTNPGSMIFTTLLIALFANLTGFLTSFYLIDIPNSAMIVIIYGIISVFFIFLQRISHRKL